jgi:hypothetical protein
MRPVDCSTSIDGGPFADLESDRVHVIGPEDKAICFVIDRDQGERVSLKIIRWQHFVLSWPVMYVAETLSF